MNIMLWILQALLATAFAAHGWMLVSPPPELLPIMNEQLGVAFRLLRAKQPKSSAGSIRRLKNTILRSSTTLLARIASWSRSSRRRMARATRATM